MKKENIGSSFDDWLRGEGTYEETSATAIKCVLARQINDSVTLNTLLKAATAVGRQLNLELV